MTGSGWKPGQSGDRVILQIRSNRRDITTSLPRSVFVPPLFNIFIFAMNQAELLNLFNIWPWRAVSFKPWVGYVCCGPLLAPRCPQSQHRFWDLSPLSFSCGDMADGTGWEDRPRHRSRSGKHSGADDLVKSKSDSSLHMTICPSYLVLSAGFHAKRRAQEITFFCVQIWVWKSILYLSKQIHRSINVCLCIINVTRNLK